MYKNYFIDSLDGLKEVSRLEYVEKRKQLDKRYIKEVKSASNITLITYTTHRIKGA